MLGSWRSCERDTGSFSHGDLLCPTNPSPCHQGKSLGAGVPRSPPQTSHRTGSSGSRLLQSPICGLEGFRGVAPHHRSVYPEHLHRISAISHGDSSVRPPFHSPRRLDDLLRSAGRIPPSSDPSGIASVSPWEESPTSRVLCFGLTHTSKFRSIRNRVQGIFASPWEESPTSSGSFKCARSWVQEVVLDPISGHDLG